MTSGHGPPVRDSVSSQDSAASQNTPPAANPQRRARRGRQCRATSSSGTSAIQAASDSPKGGKAAVSNAPDNTTAPA